MLRKGSKVGKQLNKTSLMLMVLLLCVSLVGVSGCSKTTTTGTQGNTIELKLAHFWPAAHPAETQLVQPWAKDIEKASNGRIKITSYPGETLAKANDIYDGVVKGSIDIGISCFSYTKGRFPVCEVFELPGITYNTSKAASRVAWETLQELNPKEVQDTHLIMVLTTGPGDIYSKTPVRTLEDLKGLEIRATGMSAKTLAALGATPVGMPQSDAYESLSKGVVKANLGPDEVLKGWKQAEVTRYLTKTPFLYNTVFFVTMNKDRWNALDPDMQKIITDVSKKYFEEVAAGLWDKQNQEALKWAVDEKKMEVINLSPEETGKWIGLVTPVQQETLEAINKTGLNGQEIITKVKALADRYNQQYQ